MSLAIDMDIFLMGYFLDDTTAVSDFSLAYTTAVSIGVIHT